MFTVFKHALPLHAWPVNQQKRLRSGNFTIAMTIEQAFGTSDSESNLRACLNSPGQAHPCAAECDDGPRRCFGRLSMPGICPESAALPQGSQAGSASVMLAPAGGKGDEPHLWPRTYPTRMHSTAQQGQPNVHR